LRVLLSQPLDKSRDSRATHLEEEGKKDQLLFRVVAFTDIDTEEVDECPNVFLHALGG